MRQSLNLTDVKKNNQRLVLDAVFQRGVTTRSQLAKELSLSKPAISDNLQHLLDLGIVQEAGEGEAGSAGGRKAILLRFEPAHKLIVSVNLNFSNPVFVLGDLNGQVINSFDISIADGISIQDCMNLVFSSIRVLMRSVGSAADIYCIAVAAPGAFTRDGDLASFNTACGGPAWWQVDLKHQLTEAFHLPVIIYNDVNASTLGEWLQGNGTLGDDLLYMSVGLGLGAGLILNGKPFLGSGCNAGEIYDYIDTSLPGGGQLEDTVCIKYLREQCAAHPLSPFSSEDTPTFSEIVALYDQGNTAVAETVDDICRRLAIISYNLMNFLSLPQVIFGGEYAPFSDCFRRHLATLYENSTRPMPGIHRTALGKLAGTTGMFYLARQQYFDEICSR